MGIVSKYPRYGHTFQIGTYLKIDKLPNLGMVSKYGHTFQIWPYIKIRSINKYGHVLYILVAVSLYIPNMVMVSKYGYVFQTVRKTIIFFFILTYL